MKIYRYLAIPFFALIAIFIVLVFSASAKDEISVPASEEELTVEQESALSKNSSSIKANDGDDINSDSRQNTSYSLEDLKSSLEEMKQSEELRHGSISFTLLDENGESLAGYQSEKAFTPASNIKVLTTGIALKLLKEDYRYETILGYTGDISNGVLTGNLVIKGSGDPTLGSTRFKGNPSMTELFLKWTEVLKSQGIKAIKGDIIADPSAFNVNTVPDGWIWTDIGNYYGAGPSGLNINENLYKLYFRPGAREGDETHVLRTEPDLPYLSFINEIKTGKAGSGDNGYIFGGIYSDTRILQGTIPAGFKEFPIKGAIPDAPFATAFLLKKELQKQGVDVNGNPVNLQKEKQKNSSIVGFKTLYTHKSPFLKEIVKETNVNSINLYAEAILNTLGKELGKGGDTKAGIDVVFAYLKKEGINLNEALIVDGSGLSPSNAVSTRAFAKFLNGLKTNSSFLQSLPISGKTGTLAYMCKGTVAEGRILAKSGSFNKVLGYSGFVKTKDGSLLPFSVIVNNYSGSSLALRKKIEKLMIAMATI